ncbi:MAG TPA: EamA family transporter [Candidatus Eisenbacteria bacterium]|nr:EamA family transporter [Candidatus Eisenbacteria bacterium]
MIAALARRASAPLSLTLLAFACIYLIWGSTYLVIRFAIETIPPLLMVGIRFLIAGALLYAWTVSRGQARRPSAREWGAATVFGGLFFLVGNGGVSWSEQRIPSGIVALLVAAIPLWTAIFEWRRRGGRRPGAMAIAGVALGFGGIALLIGPGESLTRSAVDPVGALVMTLAPLGWAYGMVHARNAPHPPSLLQTAAMQMLAGGAASLLLGTLMGEWRGASLDAVTLRSLLALLYLIVLGSIIAFSAFAYLLQTNSSDRVATYAYVNPIVAVILGWAVGGEPITSRILVAGSIVILGVVLILQARARAAGPAVVAADAKEIA